MCANAVLSIVHYEVSCDYSCVSNIVRANSIIVKVRPLAKYSYEYIISRLYNLHLVKLFTSVNFFETHCSLNCCLATKHNLMFFYLYEISSKHSFDVLEHKISLLN